MTEQTSPQSERDLVDALVDLFNEVEPDTSEEIDAVLHEAGHDPEEVTSRIKAAVERALTDSPLNWRNKARNEIEEERTRLTTFTPSVSGDRVTLLESIQRLLASLQTRNGTLAAAYHRNLEEATNEDLAGLLAELEYLAAQSDNPTDSASD